MDDFSEMLYRNVIFIIVVNNFIYFSGVANLLMGTGV